MRGYRRPAIAILVLVSLWPTMVFGQAQRAGIVATVVGTVTVARTNASQPMPLKFKDDVFVHDKLMTGDRSIARLLLGGKAVVTIRERSVLTITEVPGRSTVDIESGKIAMAVAKEKMQPGERIEVRSANAVAGVRGTVFVFDVARTSAQVGGGAIPVVTSIYVFRGAVDVTPAGQPTVSVPANSFTSILGRMTAPPTIAPTPPAVAAQALQGVVVSPQPLSASSNQQQVATQSVQQAVLLASAVTGGGTDTTGTATEVQNAISTSSNSSSSTTTTTTNNTNVINPLTDNGGNVGTTTSNVVVFPSQVTVNDAVKNFLATTTSTTDPGLTIPNSASPLTLTGDGNLIDVMSVSGTASPLTRPLVTITGAGGTPDLSATSLLNVAGPLDASSVTSPLIVSDPTAISTTGDFISVVSGGNLVLGGSLFTDTGGTLHTGGNVLTMNGGGTITTSDTAPVIALSGSTVTATGHLLALNGGSIARSTGSTGTSPLITVSGGSVTTGGSVIALNGGTVGTPLLSINNGVTLGAPSLLTVGGVVNAVSVTSPLIQSDPVTVATTISPLPTTPPPPPTPGSLTTDFLSIASGGILGLGGTLFTDLDSSLGTGGNFLGVTGAIVTTGAAPVIVLNGSTIRATGSLLALNGGTIAPVSESTGTAALVTISGGNVATAASLIGLNGGTIATPGSLLSVSGGATLSAPNLLNVMGTVDASLVTSALVASDPTTISTTGDLLTVGNGGNLSLGGALFSDSGSTVSVGGKFLSVNGGTITGFGTAPAISLNGSNVTLGGTTGVSIAGGATVVLSGPLLSITGGSLHNNGGAGPAVSVDGASVLTTGGTAISLVNQSLNFSPSSLVELSNGSGFSNVRSANTLGAFHLSGGSIAALSLVHGDGSGNAIIVNGTLLDLSNITVTLGSLISTASGGPGDIIGGTLTTGVPFVNMGPGSTLNLTFGGTTVPVQHIAFGVDTGAIPNQAGLALVSAGTPTAPNTLTYSGYLLGIVGDNLTDTTAQIQLTNTTLTQNGAGGLIQVTGPLAVTSAGGLLQSVASTINLAADLLVVDGGALTTSTASPVLSIDPTTLTLGGSLVAVIDQGHLSSASTLFTAAGGSTVNANGAGVPLFLVNGGLTVTGATNGLLSLDHSTVNASGPLLFAIGTVVPASGPTPSFVIPAPVTLDGSVATLTNGSTLATTQGPLVQIRSGSLQAESLIATDGLGNTVSVTGSAAAPTSGALLDLTNATVTLQKLFDRPAGSTDVVTLTVQPDEPVLRMDTSTLTLTGDTRRVVHVAGTASSTLTWPGVALVATGSTLNLGSVDSLLEANFATLTSAQPQIQLTSTTLNQSGGSGLINVTGPVNVSPAAALAAPLLAAVGSTITAGSDLLRVDGQLVSATSPLLSFNGTTVTAGANLVDVQAAQNPTSTLTLGGSLVLARSGSITVGTGLGGLTTTSLSGLPQIWEPSFGSQVINCDDCTTNVSFGFNFPFLGQTYTGAEVSSNGFISLGGLNGQGCCNPSVSSFVSGFARIAAAWFDLVGSVKYNTFAGRAVVTWDHQTEFFGIGSNTFQLQVLQSGQIILGYAAGVTNVQHTLLVGVTPGLGVADPGSSDLSHAIPFNSGSVGTVYELFNTGAFDLAGLNIVFTPAGAGWNVSALASGSLLSLGTGAAITETQAGVPLIDLGGTVLTANGSFLSMTGGAQLTLAGPLLTAAGGSIDLTNPGTPFLFVNGTLTATGTGNNLVNLNGSTLTGSGPLLSINTGTVTVGGALMRLTNGSTVTATQGPVVQIVSGTLTADSLFSTDGTNTLTLTGSAAQPTTGLVFDLSNATVTLRQLVDPPHSNEGTLTEQPDQPMIRMAGSTLTLTGATGSLIDKRLPGSAVTDLGVGLVATGSTLTLGSISDLLKMRDTTFTSLNAQIQLASTTVTLTGDFIQVQGQVSVAGPLLTDLSGTLNTQNSTRNTVLGAVGVGNSPIGVAVSPDGSRIYVGNSSSGTVSVIDANSRAVVATITVPADGFIAVTPDGTRLYVANSGGTVSVINTSNNSVSGAAVTVGSSPFGVAVTPDGAHVYVTNQSSNTVSVIDTATNTLNAATPSIAVGAHPGGIAISPDGSKVYVANNAGSISVIATATNTVTATITSGLGTNPSGMALTPDGSRLYVANAGSNTVSVIDTATNTVVRVTINGVTQPLAINVGTQPLAIAMRPDGFRAYVANTGSGTVSVIDTGNNVVVATVNSVGSNLSGLTITPDGKLAWIASTGGNQVAIVDTYPGGSFLSVPAGATLTSSTTAPLLQFNGSTVNAGYRFIDVNGTLQVQGPLISAVNGASLTSSGNFVNVGLGGALDDAAASAALLNFSGGSVTSTFGQIVSVNGNPGGSAMMSLARPLFSENGTTVQSYFNFFRIGDGGSVTSSTTLPLIQFAGGSFTGGTGGTAGTGSGGSLLRMISLAGESGTSLTLAGSLLSASGGATLNASSGVFVDIRDSAVLHANGSAPFLDFNGASATSLNNFFDIAASSTSSGASGTGVGPIATFAGSLFHAADTGTPLTFSAGSNFLSIFDGASVTKTGSAPMLDFEGTVTNGVTASTAFSIVFVGIGAAGKTPPALTLAGPLLTAVNASVLSGTPGTNTFTNLFVGDGAVLTKTDSTPLMNLDTATLTTAASVVTIRRSPSAGVPSTINLGSADLLEATNSTLTTSLAGFFVGQGSHLTGSGTIPVVSLTNGTTFNAGSNMFQATSGGSNAADTFNVTTLPSTISLGDGLLSASSSTLNVPGALLSVSGGSQVIVSNSATDPVFAITGGTHSIASNTGAAVLQLSGRGSATTTVTPTGTSVTLTVGTDTPLQMGSAPAVLATSGATVNNAKQVVTLDTALLEATVPILKLTAASAFTTASDAFALNQRAQLTATGPLVQLNASTLTVNSGSLFNVQNIGGGGSFLNVTGNLVALNNGSTLNVLNGFLVSVSGGSVFSLSGGSLIAFGGTASTANLGTSLSSLCSGCSLVTNIPNLGSTPVILSNNATASQISVTSGFTAISGTGTVNTGSFGAVLKVDGTVARVVLKP